MSSYPILDSPSAQRNKEPIWQVLSTKVLPLLEESSSKGLTVLELAAGCGVHTEYFAPLLVKSIPVVTWYPTDPDETSREAIHGRIQAGVLSNLVQAPRSLTLHANGIIEQDTESVLLDASLDLMICINMLHISPWDASIGLMKVAQKKLRRGGVLYCYGPYKVRGTAVESNLSFDRSLRMRDPSWGVRDLEQLVNLAEQNGLTLVETIEMPANNLSVLYQKK